MTKLFNKIETNQTSKSFGTRKIETKIEKEIVGSVCNFYVNDDGSVYRID